MNDMKKTLKEIYQQQINDTKVRLQTFERDLLIERNVSADLRHALVSSFEVFLT